MSSRQISVPSSEALPPPAKPPVCAIDMPILIGGCWASAFETGASPATMIAAPRSVLRFIFPPPLSFFDCPQPAATGYECQNRDTGPSRRLLQDCGRIGPDASAGPAGRGFAGQAQVEADARHALDRAVRILRIDVDREITRRAEHDVVGQM